MFGFQFEHSLVLEMPPAFSAELDAVGLLHELWYKFMFWSVLTLAEVSHA